MTIKINDFTQQAVSKITLSRAAFDELLSVKATLESCAESDRFYAEIARVDSVGAPALHAELGTIRNAIDYESHVLILEGFKADDVASFKSLVWSLGALLGAPMVQNALGHKVIEVYDRGGKSIEEGARYHQTRQGAYVHNDGVSDPLPIDYLILACGQKALLGGESILVDAAAVYAQLVAFPEVLEVLQREFYFENRGMSDEEQFFKSPVLSFSNSGIPLIRYFRVYIESAHLKAGVPLTRKQVRALDFLDAVLDQSPVQHRVLLEPGQVLISADNKFLHTRTHFIDKHPPHVAINDAMSLNDLNRYMLRMWLRKI